MSARNECVQMKKTERDSYLTINIKHIKPSNSRLMVSPQKSPVDLKKT